MTFRRNVFTFNGLRDVISQKTEIFMNSVVIPEGHRFNPKKLELSSNALRDILAVVPFVSLSSP
jgi:hypothetical protein